MRPDMTTTKSDQAPPASCAEAQLLRVLDVVRRYLPPDGIDAKAAMSEITALVDPWPAAGCTSPPRELTDTEISKIFERLFLASEANTDKAARLFRDFARACIKAAANKA